jgi:hypothetical protein
MCTVQIVFWALESEDEQFSQVQEISACGCKAQVS